MYNYKIEPWLVNVTNENMKSRVFTIDSNEKCFNLTRGICQGSANGPVTLSLYINDIVNVINVAHLMYADDIVIYTEGQSIQEIAEKLRVEMLKIQEWCKVNSMSVNYDKTKLMFFHKSKDVTIKNEKLDYLVVGNECIERIYEFKYLGIMFDPCLNFNLHYNIVCANYHRG